MQASRRTEPFRYLFVTPELCYFQIRELNGVVFGSKSAPAELVDIHKSGCRIATPLDLRAADHAIKLTLELPFFAEGPLSVTGDVRWQQFESDKFLYGIQFMADEHVKERIRAELRRLAGERRIQAV